ncbi:LLM class flavin-dependent oxidoreductase [Fodinicola acaciae]|uniref:LLM class flavin-dependent oxidoreductase n=1 Tax=Fodinicola acaciae TaxID=2681555 RepID=UPI0013D26505|nr:LLM class flavin-dependent oxidoreductase [Fodinicola acaciae]
MTATLSVFDFALLSAGSDARQALRRMLDLAVRTESWGYRRFWMSEHHNMRAVATSSPAVLVGQVAAATSTIRVGSGGVILPNHPPLVVAEQFGTLEALFPGRIDLGLGRASQMDPETAAALRRAGGAAGGDFAEQLTELLGYFDGTTAVRAVPAVGFQPPIWLLGTGHYSAELAGKRGLPFAFGHHFRPDLTTAALTTYRENFQPSAALSQPYAMVAAAVIVADDDATAEWLHGPSRVNMLSARRGKLMDSLPTTEQAAGFDYTEEERAIVRAALDAQIIGGPATAEEKLRRLLKDTGADELMAVTITHDHADRLRSYELLANLRLD